MSPGSSPPPDGGAAWWSVIAGTVAVVLTTLAGVIKVSRDAEKIESTAKAAKELSTENKKAIEALQVIATKVETHEDTIKKILGLFSDEHGNQRLMTTLSCGQKSASCNAIIAERMKHMGEMFGQRIADMSGKMDALERSFSAKQDEALKAILAEIRKDK